ncbi:MAG: nucleotide pyrophosphohydrolase [Paenibacillaceae bacterium]|nr:nucleotide pyrophosphohydrolase [Paenibacillaceae bacterium]
MGEQMKTICDVQREVDALIAQYKDGYFTPLVMLARLTEEVGELAREVNDAFGQKPKRADEPPGSIAMELADVLFVVVCFANALGIDLEHAFDQAMNKFRTRDAHRWPRNDR